MPLKEIVFEDDNAPKQRTDAKLNIVKPVGKPTVKTTDAEPDEVAVERTSDAAKPSKMKSEPS